MPTNFDVAIASFDELILQLEREFQRLTLWEKLTEQGRKIKNDIDVLKGNRNTLIRERDATPEQRALLDPKYLEGMEALHIPANEDHKRLQRLFGAQRWTP